MVLQTDTKQPAHRPGLFKLPSKKHKTGQHRSKGEIARSSKGKIGIRTTSLKKSRNLTKAQRKNQINQLWAHKREQLLERMMVNGSPNNRAPFLSTILSFDENFDGSIIIEKLLSADSSCTLNKSNWSNAVHVNVPRFKARYTFLSPKQDNIIELLDCVRVSEVLIIIWSGTSPITEKQQQLLTTIMVQGMPVVLNLVIGMPPNGKLRDQMRKVLEKSMSYWPSLSDSKVNNFDTASDSQKIFRLISSMQKKSTIVQQRHPFLLVDCLATEDLDLENNTCTLKVSGYLRGAPLSVNKLVHIQCFGDFQLSKVDVLKQCNRSQMDSVVSLFPTNSTIIPNYENHQEDIEMQEDNSTLVDDDNDDDEEEEEEEEEEDSDNDEEENESMGRVESDNENEDMDDCSDEEDGLTDSRGDNIDMTEVQKYRVERENAQWPDEVETPHNILARERFQKFRGLKSFRTSPWDPKENLPKDYSRIYKFFDFRQTKKKVLSDIRKLFLNFKNGNEDNEFAYPGSYVTLYISNVPSVVQNELTCDKAFVIFGLLNHEEKLSVMNMVLEKHSLSRIPIQNREKLIFQVGYRRFESEALFTQHNNGNKFKMERFMPSTGTFCATVFAPIVFPPATVLVFRRDAKNRLSIVASGNVLDLNPDRIILKRVVLSGHPFKVNKRLAVVKYMFFNKEDVEWFKPVEVYTAKGRRGHIKESLGTHGLVKCLFDQPLSTQDSVLMNLYKRVFPKFTYNARITITN